MIDREFRCNELTCNAGADDFPADPVQFLRDFPDDYMKEDSLLHPGKCVVIWEPFVGYPAEALANYIETGNLY
ncbi:hypothetical protein [Selenomonas ruminantium]|uniref:hypothetical protein n=1 Tax=Selenomonas ruminantium TaxID=971 RepID=UPI00047E78DD|nr:hypothetical protein [Selenomonas ruminantium]